MSRVLGISYPNTTMTFQRICMTAAAACIAATSAEAAVIYGLGTDNHLYRFDSANPAAATDIGLISQPGIVDIDFHAANGALYGVTGSGMAYGISTTDASALLRVTPTSGAITGTVQDADFNPMADRIRISASGGGNYRLVPDFITAPSPAGTSGAVVNDGFYSGAPISVTVVSTAYTNAFDSPPSTALFSIGSDGFLYAHSTGAGPVGSFGVMTAVGPGIGFGLGGNVGFDIAGANTAFVNVANNLYTLDLTSGIFTDLPGTVGAPLASIAIVPEPSTTLLGILGGVSLLRRRKR